MRRILQQVQLSTLPQSWGLCSGDLPSVASIVNIVTERLVYAGGDSGWWGAWSKVLFTASQANPYITLPPIFARAINMAVCNFPIRIQNEFYELIEAGIGLQPPTGCQDWCGALQGFERGVFSTMVDLPAGNNSYLRVYITDNRDIGRRILFQGATDQNGNGIYSTDGNENPNGFYIDLASPFNTTTFIVSGWQAIAKDGTFGDVILKAVDATSGLETTLSRYQPWETNPAYRRYYLNNIPNNCCNQPTSSTNTVSITAMCKHEFIPVVQPTDALLIGNLPALEEEGLAYLDSKKEDPGAAGRVARHHAKAISLLNQEMTHYLGTRQPAINFAPFGTAHQWRQRIGQVR